MGLADNPGPDDEFFAHMREQLNNIAVPRESNVQELDLISLLKEINKIDAELRELGEMHKQTSATGRELHSRRAALMIEKHRRNQQ